MIAVAAVPAGGPVAFSPDGMTLAASGAIDGRVGLWNPRTGTPRGRAWVANAGFVQSTVFSPDGTVLATSGTDGIAALWDARSGKQIGAPLLGANGGWTFTAFSPDGHTCHRHPERHRPALGRRLRLLA
jgi:WD40 repeat protein